jgi:hypothetical protein
MEKPYFEMNKKYGVRVIRSGQLAFAKYAGFAAGTRYGLVAVFYLEYQDGSTDRADQTELEFISE